VVTVDGLLCARYPDIHINVCVDYVAVTVINMIIILLIGNERQE